MAEAQYASGTDVPAEKTRIEIERFLRRRGATAIASYWDEGKAMLGFTLQGRSYRLDVPLPDRNDRAITHTPSRKWRRSEAEAQKAYEEEVKRRWRVLLLLLKAALEAVDAGVLTLDRALLTHVLLPNGDTLGEWADIAIPRALSAGTVPLLGSGRE